MSVYMLGLAATAFGLASPWVTCEISSFRWWGIWFAAGSAGFLAAFWISARLINGGNVDVMMTGFGLFWLQLLSVAVFAASFAVKAWLLQKGD
jgi:hypothetical protein